MKRAVLYARVSGDDRGQEGRNLESRQPQAMGLLGAVLDADGDGDFDLGDAAKHGIKALGKFFKK